MLYHNTIIDTHCHIYDDIYGNNVHQVIKDSTDNQIAKLLMPNIDLESLPKMIALQKLYPKTLYNMIGLHPCYVTENFQSTLKSIYRYLDNNTFIAIGEVGLDLYHSKNFFKEQCEAFEISISWAEELKLPIVIHAREAHTEVIDILKKRQNGNLSGVFHCFSGTVSEAKEIIDLGFKLGIGGLLTFNNSHLRDTIRHLNVNNILLETDAPYLTPLPHRGKGIINEPKYIINVLNTLSEILAIDSFTLSSAIYKNTLSLFSSI